MHYHLRTLALCITVGLAGYFIGTSVVSARFPGGNITGKGTQGRIAKFIDDQMIADSVIREANGNIGVGSNAINAPALKLFVNGRLGASANTTGGVGALVANQNGSGPIASFRTNQATRMIIDSNGSVGIGTDAPNSPLEVAGKIHSTSDGFMFPDGTVQDTASPAAFSGAKIFSTSPQLIPDDQWTQVAFDAEAIDTDDYHEDLASLVSIPSDGIYLLTANVGFNENLVPTIGVRNVAIRAGGDNIALAGLSPEPDIYLATSTIAELAEGTNITVWVRQRQGSTLELHNETTAHACNLTVTRLTR